MKYIITTTLILLSIYANAQVENLLFLSQIEKKTSYKQELDFDFTYNYNQSSASQVYADINYKNCVTKWLDIHGGFHSQTNSIYALLARADFKLKLHSHHSLELRNQYLYNIFASSNSQSFNALLAAAYNQDYCYIAIGAHTQFFAPIFSKDNPSILYEPIHLCYDIEGRLFPKLHSWNIALQITNITPFLIERAYSPNFIIKGNAKIIETENERIDITYKIGGEPSGIFHAHAQQYEFFVAVGLKCSL